MAIRESVQPPARTSELPHITHSFTEKSVVPTVNNAPSAGKQPELIVSHPKLTFVQRTADKPVFCVLAIAQQNIDTPITISTDEPDYFQLASDSRPAFAPTLTFIPPPSGAYVHVRYMAPKGGSHHAQLIIEAPYASTTVALEARTTGALSIVRNVLVPAKRPERKASGSRWGALLATVIVGGLAYAGYTYQCQLFPSLCREKTVELAQPKSYTPLPKPATDYISSRKENSGRSRRKKANVSAKTRSQSEQTPVLSVDRTAGQMPDNQSNELRKTAPSRTSTNAIDKETGRENTELRLPSQVRRKQDSTIRAKESELERELNKQL